MSENNPVDVSELPARTSARRKLGGRSQRTGEQREADFAFIAALMITGKTHKEIADALSAARPYSLSRQQISVEVKHILKRWKIVAHENITEHRAIYLAKLDKIEALCWMNIERLESPQQSTSLTVTRITDTGQIVRKSQITKANDNIGHWHRQLSWCMEQRAKLLGLYAAVKIDAPGAQLSFGDTHQAVSLTLNIISSKPVDELGKFPIVDESGEDSEDVHSDLA